VTEVARHPLPRDSRRPARSVGRDGPCPAQAADGEDVLTFAGSTRRRDDGGVSTGAYDAESGIHDHARTRRSGEPSAIVVLDTRTGASQHARVGYGDTRLEAKGPSSTVHRCAAASR